MGAIGSNNFWAELATLDYATLTRIADARDDYEALKRCPVPYRLALQMEAAAYGIDCAALADTVRQFEGR